MSINFPNSPTANQIFYDASSGNRYRWDAVATSWKSSPNTAITVTISTTPPGSPTPGSFWWDTISAKLFIYYDDGDSTQWVEASPNASSIDLDLFLSYLEPVYASSNQAFTVANGSYSQSNVVFNQANVTFNQANLTFNRSNVTTNNLYTTANTANAAFTVANNAITLSIVYSTAFGV